MRKSQFIKHLEELNEDDLRDELLQLYKQVPEVKTYYSMELGTEKERKKLYDRTKKEIIAKYATKSFRRPRRPRIQKINLILAEMKRKSIFAHEMADLYLFDVEEAISFSRKYQFYSDVLSNHVIKTFTEACRIIQEQVLHDTYKERCESVLSNVLYYPTIHMDLEPIFDTTFHS
ncbi:MAG: hypothetical protein ACI9FN_001961 [Saprospiraceae bacterium]